VTRGRRGAGAGAAERVPADRDVVVVARPEARELAEREGLDGIRRELADLLGRALVEGARS
jgi:ribonuclease P protein component